jgi:molybdenum cofactor guanylyltransferase
MTSTAKLFGLVLAGGASTRMRSDKAALTYQGQTQLDRAFALVSQFCESTFVSVRAGQEKDSTRSKFPQIVDQGGVGPIAGIRAALATHPDTAWLVVACDLPFLDAATLTFLREHRDPSRIATAFKSSHDGLPEPLCTIWEPAALEALEGWISQGKDCPRKLLINSNTHLLELPESRALDNINTPDEFARAQSTLSANAKFRHLKVQYFALFREQAGRKEELLDSRAATPRDLYAELQSRYPFQLAEHQLKVAVNAEFVDWARPLADGDTVVFIPPVAGG